MLTKPSRCSIITEQVKSYVRETLQVPQILLLSFFIWYLFIVISFSSNYLVWVNAIVMAFFVGNILCLNAYMATKKEKYFEFLSENRWIVVRLFLIPFCVSSYSGVAFSHGFIAAFPVNEYTTGLIGLGISLGFMGVLLLLMVLFERSSTLN